jgi:hypothetical protein
VAYSKISSPIYVELFEAVHVKSTPIDIFVKVIPATMYLEVIKSSNGEG